MLTLQQFKKWLERPGGLRDTQRVELIDKFFEGFDSYSSTRTGLLTAAIQAMLSDHPQRQHQPQPARALGGTE